MKTSSTVSLILIAWMAVSGCEKSDYNYIKTRNQAYYPQREGGIVFPDSTREDGTPHVFLTAVEFADGYDWRKDREFGDVKCNIVVYKDGARYLSIPAGKGTQALPDHDMHHLVNGHLFSEYSTGESTIIKMDGSDLIVYKGNEYMKSIMIKDNTVYTLGQDRDGDGFSLRQMGDIIIQKDKGRIINGLFEDEGELCFVYHTAPYKNISGNVEEWHLVCNGNDYIIQPPKDVYDILDIRRINGSLFIAAKSNSLGYPAFFVDGKKYDVSGGGSLIAKSCKIVVDGDIYLEGNFIRSGYIETHSIIWRWNSLLSEVPHPNVLFLRRANGISYVIPNKSGELNVYSNILGSDTISSDNYFFTERSAVDFNGDLYIITVPKTPGEYPSLWKNGIETKYEFNGYFTSVSVSG